METRSVKRVLIGLSLSVLSTSCAGTPVQSDKPYAAAGYDTISNSDLKMMLPEWAYAEMQREAELSPAEPLVLGDQHKFSLLGSPPEEPVWNEEDDFWYFMVDYGGEYPLECDVYNNDSDPFYYLQSRHESSKANYLPENATVDLQIVTHSGIHIKNEQPVAAADYFYVITETQSDERSLLNIQGRVSYKNNHVLACIGDGFGYRSTIDQIFNELVASWEQIAASKTQEPYYRELHLVKLASNNSGFVEYTFEEDAEGDTEIRLINGMMIKVDESTLNYTDSYMLEYSTPDGALINAYAHTYSNNELTYNLAAGRSETDDSWLIEGTFHEKPVEYTIAAAEQPISQLGQLLMARDLIGNAGQSDAKSRVWAPSADPSAFMDLALAMDSREQNTNQVEFNVGPISSQVVLLDSGVAKTTLTNIGAIAMETELQTVEGRVE